MKRYTCVLTLLVVVLASFALPSTARAAERYRLRGKVAYANFYVSDPTACISTTLYIFAAEKRSQDSPGAPTDSAAAEFGFLQWDCTFQTVACVYGSIPLPDDAFNMAGNLASATLTATIPGHDCSSGNPHSLSVALHWTGEGDVFHGNFHDSYHSPGYLASYRSSGQTREALPSGSVTLDGTTLSFENGNAYGSLDVVTTGEFFRSH